MQVRKFPAIGKAMLVAAANIAFQKMTGYLVEQHAAFVPFFYIGGFKFANVDLQTGSHTHGIRWAYFNHQFAAAGPTLGTVDGGTYFIIEPMHHCIYLLCGQAFKEETKLFVFFFPFLGKLGNLLPVGL